MKPHISSTVESGVDRIDALLRVVDATTSLAAEHNLDGVLAAVTQLACEAIGCERASVFTFDPASQSLISRVTTELEVREIRLLLGEGIAGWAAQRREMVHVPDPHLDLRWSDVVDRVTGYQTRNLLVAPLLAPPDRRLVGVLQLLNKTGGFDAFDERLVSAFASHAAIALERSALLEDVRKSQALKMSLQLGREIQTGFLPKELPTIPGYEIAAWWEPAEGVGGDYYDVLPLPDGRLGLVIADVSGHGIGPSLLMASVRAMLHILARTESNPTRILTLLSEAICKDFELGRFVTLLFVVLDPVRHELTWVNAGHGPSLFLNRHRGHCHMLETTTLPLGLGDGQEFPMAGPMSIEPGDLLLLATDGAIEIRDQQGRMFGRRRLEEVFLHHQDQPAARVCDALRDTVRAVQPFVAPPDDITMLLLERKRNGTTPC